MEFCYPNFVNTTTLLAVDSNSTTAKNMIDRRFSTKYESIGYGGTTATNITFTPATATVVSRIALNTHNLKDFQIFYDGTTTNTFTITGYSTSTIQYTTNSETSNYWVVSSQTVSSITLRATEAMTASSEKFITALYVGEIYHRLTKNPDTGGYSPRIKEKNFLHQMSDGGIIRYFLSEKFSATLKIPFVSQADRTSLKTAYSARTALQFIPFPTESDWDGDMYEVNWVNGFDLQKLTSNVIGNGYSGVIMLEETPSK